MDFAFKKRVHQHCLKQLRAGIHELRTALENAQSSANEETKSSAGDKHETGRAMAQLEVEKLATQYNQTLRSEEYLMSLNPDSKHLSVVPGTLVETDQGFFYLSIPLGKLMVDGHTVFIISGASPIGKLLIGKQENAVFTFNGITYHVLKVI